MTGSIFDPANSTFSCVVSCINLAEIFFFEKRNFSIGLKVSIYDKDLLIIGYY